MLDTLLTSLPFSSPLLSVLPFSLGFLVRVHGDFPSRSILTYEFALSSVPPFCGLPPPELFSLGDLVGAPSCAPLALDTSGLLGLTSRLFPPPSFSAELFSPSGDVLPESNAAFECAASSSEPDFEYSLDVVLIESLSWASFCARLRGFEEK
jgi:hypothetical protein